MARTPRPAISTASGVFQPAPLTGLDTKLSTIAVENIGPMASAWATAAGVPNRRWPSPPLLAGVDGASDMSSSLWSIGTWIHSQVGHRGSRPPPGSGFERVQLGLATVCKVHERAHDIDRTGPAADPERRRPCVRRPSRADPVGRHPARDTAAPGVA